VNPSSQCHRVPRPIERKQKEVSGDPGLRIHPNGDRKKNIRIAKHSQAQEILSIPLSSCSPEEEEEKKKQRNVSLFSSSLLLDELSLKR